jgi:LytS/YehU family sensor histidine kinase
MKITLAEKDKLLIYLHNTKANPPVIQDAGGIGLANIQKRLQLVYPYKHTLAIEDDKQFFSVTLFIVIA